MTHTSIVCAICSNLTLFAILVVSSLLVGFVAQIYAYKGRPTRLCSVHNNHFEVSCVNMKHGNLVLGLLCHYEERAPPTCLEVNINSLESVYD